MKPQLSVRGRKVLEKALAAMKRYPDTFDMRDWLAHDPIDKSKRAPYCGTVACLAGHIALAAGWRPIKRPIKRSFRLQKRGQRMSVVDAALGALGVEDEERLGTRTTLFYELHWPFKFADRYRKWETPRQRVAATIARVRHWLKTGE